jgi:hypothetical protein
MTAGPGPQTPAAANVVPVRRASIRYGGDPARPASGRWKNWRIDDGRDYPVTITKITDRKD